MKLYCSKLITKEITDEHINNCINNINSYLSGVGELPVYIYTLNSDEHGFELSITSQKGVEIISSRESVFFALSHLQKLIEYDDDGSYLYETTVHEKAAFKYRGFMFDEARHFFGKEVVKMYLDILFRLKMNVFHWNLSNHQGFRINLEKYVGSEKKPCFRNKDCVSRDKKVPVENKIVGGYYEPQDIKEIVEYAKDRGIKVIPEISMPGHMSALLSYMHNLTCKSEPFEVPHEYKLYKRVLCIGNDDARRYAKDLMLDVANLFKTDTVHIGFDEVKIDNITNCKKCQSRIKKLGIKNENELIVNFRKEMTLHLKNNSIKTICWTDTITETDEDVTGQMWLVLNLAKDKKLVNRGQKVIMSHVLYLYMDMSYKMIPLKKTYNFNPYLKGIKEKNNVIGIEAPVWTETITNVDKLKFYTFYRLLAVAKIGWEGDKRNDYSEFIKDLRKYEEYYFGEKLNIPDEVISPKNHNLFGLKGLIPTFRDTCIEYEDALKLRK